MYCANPDFETVESNSNNNVFCMGAIGEIYKKMGGNVILKGKPDVSIYTATTNQINLEKKRTVAIGDSLFHDIQGANNFEIDSVLVKSGIHKDLNQINNLIKSNEEKVRMLKSASSWFGVTYKEDKPFVETQIQDLISSGIYPSKLF